MIQVTDYYKILGFTSTTMTTTIKKKIPTSDILKAYRRRADKTNGDRIAFDKTYQ